MHGQPLGLPQGQPLGLPLMQSLRQPQGPPLGLLCGQPLVRPQGQLEDEAMERGLPLFVEAELRGRQAEAPPDRQNRSRPAARCELPRAAQSVRLERWMQLER